MKKFYISIIMSSLLLTGCFEQKIDTTSKETMTKSISNVKESLSNEDREIFERYLTIILLDNIEAKDFFSLLSTDRSYDKVKNIINNKTAIEVINIGKIIEIKNKEIAIKRKIELELAEKKLEEDLKTKELSILQKLESDKEIFNKSLVDINNIKILYSDLDTVKDSFLDTKIMRLVIKNETKHTISGIYFSGILKNDERKIPWAEDNFLYNFPGGLEPGETIRLNLEPNMLSKFYSVKSPNDATFTVNVLEVYGPNKEKILDINSFNKEKEELLTKLKNKYNK